jgi:hypothetical protein
VKNLTWQNPEQLFVAQELINKVKSKCCGIKDINNIPEFQSPFEQLREVDADGKEWWNSRKLAQVMGYGK